jgi:hypothetical protein
MNLDKDLEDKISKQIKHNFQKAWCDIMRKNIEEKNWDMFKNCLLETTNRLKNMVPNRKDLQRKIDEEIPVDFILQMITNDAALPKDFIQFFSSILKWLKNLGPPDLDQQVDEISQNIYEIHPSTYFNNIPDVLLQINQHIDIIEERIIQIENLSKDT